MRRAYPMEDLTPVFGTQFQGRRFIPSEEISTAPLVLLPLVVLATLLLIFLATVLAATMILLSERKHNGPRTHQD